MNTHQAPKDRIEAGLASHCEPFTHSRKGRARCPHRAAHALELLRRPGRNTAPHLSSVRNCCFLLLSLLCLLPLRADPLDTWHLRGPGPTTNQLNAITYGGSGFVAAGNAGTLAASPDGYKWELLSAGIETNLQGVAWGDGVYAVVGDGGVILTSPDGVKWTPRQSGSIAILRAITYGTNAFVAVGAGPTLLTSTNQGATWTQAQGISVASLNTVIYEEGLFVAAGEDGGIVTSSDGLEWTVRHTGGGLNLRLLVRGNGKFIAYPWTRDVLLSDTGLDWVPGVDPWGRYLRAVAVGAELFAGVGEDHEANFWAYWDYIWHAHSKATRSRLLALAFGNGIFVYVGEGGTIEISDGAVTPTIPPNSPFRKALFPKIHVGGKLSCAPGCITLAKQEYPTGRYRDHRFQQHPG